MQLMRQCEHHMEITCLQKFFLSGVDPTLARLSLTFWTVAITARVIGDGLVATTSRTDIDMTAESRCTAMQDGPHHFQLLKPDSVSMTIDEVTALRAKDVGHLHRWPVHSPFFFRRLGFAPSPEMERASMGLFTACK